MFRKASLLGLALGALLMFGGASSARAVDDWGRGCNARINHEQRDLDRAIRQHGYRSWQAQQERRELNRAIANCHYR
jgi:hypothetical protein